MISPLPTAFRVRNVASIAGKVGDCWKLYRRGLNKHIEITAITLLLHCHILLCSSVCSKETDDSFSLQSLHVGICLPFLMLILYWSWGDLYVCCSFRCCQTFAHTIIIIWLTNERKLLELTSVTLFDFFFCLFENYANIKGNYLLVTSELGSINFKSNPALASDSQRSRLWAWSARQWAEISSLFTDGTIPVIFTCLSAVTVVHVRKIFQYILQTWWSFTQRVGLLFCSARWVRPGHCHNSWM